MDLSTFLDTPVTLQNNITFYPPLPSLHHPSNVFASSFVLQLGQVHDFELNFYPQHTNSTVTLPSVKRREEFLGESTTAYQARFGMLVAV